MKISFNELLSNLSQIVDIAFVEELFQVYFAVWEHFRTLEILHFEIMD